VVQRVWELEAQPTGHGGGLKGRRCDAL